MPENGSNLSEKTKISLTIASWWHLTILLVTIIWGASILKNSIDQATEVGRKALEQSQSNDTQIQRMEMDLKVFHQRYEDDMNHYIRDYTDPKRSR